MSTNFEDTTKATLITNCEDGELSWQRLALACMVYMTDDAIDDMARCEELILPTYDDEYYEASIVRENGGHTFLQRFDEDEADKSPLEVAETFADLHSGDYNVEVVVEKVSDNGGWREEVAIYTPMSER
jgi:hypothetical protein